MSSSESSSQDEGESFYCHEILNENVLAADSSAREIAARVPPFDSTADAVSCNQLSAVESMQLNAVRIGQSNASKSMQSDAGESNNSSEYNSANRFSTTSRGNHTKVISNKSDDEKENKNKKRGCER